MGDCFRSEKLPYRGFLTRTKEKYRNSDINTAINYTTQLTEESDGNKKELYDLDRLVSVFKESLVVSEQPLNNAASLKAKPAGFESASDANLCMVCEGSVTVLVLLTDIFHGLLARSQRQREPRILPLATLRKRKKDT